MRSETQARAPHPAKEEPPLAGQSPPQASEGPSHPNLADYKGKEKLLGPKLGRWGASWHLPGLPRPFGRFYWESGEQPQEPARLCQQL